jgi:glycosyltransferase involved in cell wall biosynthesis
MNQSRTKNMPTLSIITVNLNNKAGLINTAKSIIEQTYTDYEWIIIDGGSTDGSVEVIKECADKTDKLVYWCSEKDGGIYQGMNKGVEKANGKYCWFLNSGDYAYKNTTLEEIFSHHFDEDIVYGDILWKDGDKARYMVSNKKNVYSKSYWIRYWKSLPHPSSFIKRTLINRIGGYRTELTIIADKTLFMDAIFSFGAVCRYVPVCFSVFMADGVSNDAISAKKIKSQTYLSNKLIFPKMYRLYNCYSFLSYCLRLYRKKMRKRKTDRS